MSNYTIVATVLAAVVLAGATALAITIWRASDRIGNRNLRWISGGFMFLAAKSAFSTYTIRTEVAHHEVTEMLGSIFDVAIVLSMAAPFFLREQK